MYCPKCNKDLKQAIRNKITDKELKKPFIFSMCFICECSYIKLLKEYKIYNHTSEFAKI